MTTAGHPESIWWADATDNEAEDAHQQEEHAWRRGTLGIGVAARKRSRLETQPRRRKS
jgi:hypothetical protein